jgi:hypothetical protein
MYVFLQENIKKRPILECGGGREDNFKTHLREMDCDHG